MTEQELRHLNAAVAAAQGMDPVVVDGGFTPATRWHDAGPIIERERITIWQDPYYWPENTGTDRWLAGYNVRAVEGAYYSTLTGSDPADIVGEHTSHGETMLVAAMRAFLNKVAA